MLHTDSIKPKAGTAAFLHTLHLAKLGMIIH